MSPYVYHENNLIEKNKGSEGKKKEVSGGIAPTPQGLYMCLCGQPCMWSSCSVSKCCEG